MIKMANKIQEEKSISENYQLLIIDWVLIAWKEEF
jgi:hypothetical protein